MTIRLIHFGVSPSWPPEMHAPGVLRFLYRQGKVTTYSGDGSDVLSSDYVVDATTLPAVAEIEAVLHPVPQSVTAVQARIALTAAGKRAAVEAAVKAASQDVQDYWQFSTMIDRQHPVMLEMAALLTLTTTDLDALFKAAKTIS